MTHLNISKQRRPHGARRIHPLTGVGLEASPGWAEHRSCRRCWQGGTVLFNIFNSDQPPSVGEMRNYSQDGMYFEAAQSVRPGTPLYLRLLTEPTTPSHRNVTEYCRSISIAEVKWCRIIGDAPNSRFGIGAKFYE